MMKITIPLLTPRPQAGAPKSVRNRDLSDPKNYPLEIIAQRNFRIPLEHKGGITFIGDYNESTEEIDITVYNL